MKSLFTEKYLSALLFITDFFKKNNIPYVFTPKIQYELVAERSEANQKTA